MKKYFLLLLALTFISSSISAQKIGVRVGGNISNINAGDAYDGFDINMKYKPGFNVGLVTEIPFTDMLSLETGLLMNSKGFRLNETNDESGISYSYKGSMNLYYADVPLYVKGNFEVADYKVHGVFGPYVGFGLLGKSKTKITANDESETTTSTIKWGTDADNDDLRRLDYGVSFGAGAEIKGIELRLSYALGLANISSDHSSDGKFNNSLISISACYFLGNK
jgi:Outer membrane protein beta-barrel domain